MNIRNTAPAFAFFFCVAFFTFLTQNNAQNVTVQVKNEEAVNTKGLDFSPTFYEDGIVFISTNNAGLKKTTDEQLKLPAMSILRSRRDAEGLLSIPEPFAKELSSVYHEGPVCFDRTAETVYFSRNVIVDGKAKLAKDGVQKMRLYSARKNGETWGEPVALPFNANEFDDCHPAISIDGDKLYFASNRPGGLGGMDIYVSYKVGDSWSEPVNLGAPVNTTGNEVFPFIHADNTLYFASTGLPDGKGGLDMYCTSADGSSWTTPRNMGAPFNTSGDDFGLIVDLNKINGYYSSNASGGKGGDEIFNFHTENGNLDAYLLEKGGMPSRKLDIRVIVMDKVTNNPIEDADVRILNADANDVIGRDESGNLITIQKVDGQDVMKSMPPDNGISGLTNERGRFVSDIKSGNYVFIVAKEGYQTKQLRLPITKAGNELKVQLEKVAVAGKVRWNGSVFNYATNAPLSGATLILTNQATGVKDTVVADANGLVDYYLDPNQKYKVDMYQGGRLVGSTDIQTDNKPNQVMTTSLSVAPLLPGSIIELPNIYYNFNDATLRPDARKDLDMVVSLMKQQPAIQIELSSHTDSRGSNYYNQDLSQRRANGVSEYLVSRGVDRKRMSPVGYGESEPRNNCIDGTNCTEQEYGRNRRTEVRITTGIQGASMIYVDGQATNTANSTNADQKPQSANNVNQKPGKKTSTPTPTETDPTPVASSDRGMYYVVAGSFLMENRANTQLNTLKDAGFPDAEIVRFPNSTYFSVCAGKYGSRKEAEVVERKLEGSGQDAFVRSVQ